ncbi:DUF5047 domain-containing protein [Micromonospora inyonensis]|uniref:DUF5047 domain-containing protein n=1 Tax=Micromonospora inyonensis TaxID=47866 RepID=A0A1C6RWQ5_9ACTN|nr:DUF5047 domain-containing protein [Micromonospora inyonensis]SCL21502.1 protein of unknown function [Micromonospora inyonensis]SCL21727.1 protein of unknown function [Micromonospora inyonensis]
MRPVSERFLRALRGSHRMVVQARVVAPGSTGVNPDGTDIPILDGDVQMDGSAQVRSTLDLTTEGSLWPTRASSLLAPYGNELFVRRGVRYGNGVTEWVSLGYYRIYTPEQDDAPRGPIRVMGRDRMSGIVDGRMVAPVQFPATTTYGQVMSTLVTDIYPWVTIEWDDSTADQQIGRQIIADDDRYQVLHDLVTSVGKSWWWDHRGVLVIRTPVSSAQPVWEVNHGEGGVLVKIGRRLTREGVYNGVIAVGEGADTSTPARAVVVDNNPASPTWWDGPFGRVPRRYSSPLITSQGQADIAAASLLTAQLGLPYAVDFTAVPNPALEPGDPIRVRYPGRSEIHVIDRLTVPLAPGEAMPASTRQQTTILLGRL